VEVVLVVLVVVVLVVVVPAEAGKYQNHYKLSI
jgi:hypothetical protein